jgi:DNA-binding NtrC family response regulator
MQHRAKRGRLKAHSDEPSWLNDMTGLSDHLPAQQRPLDAQHPPKPAAPVVPNLGDFARLKAAEANLAAAPANSAPNAPGPTLVALPNPAPKSNDVDLEAVRVLVKKPLKLAELERFAIEAALERTGGNVTRAMRQLGIGRTTLYRKLKKYGLR